MGWMRFWMTMAMLAAMPNLAPAMPAAPEALKELQERFDHESNAVHKAKQMQKLGDAQFAALHDAEHADDFTAAGVILEKYRDNVRLAFEGLKKEHPDAERQSNGYRQLQMHVQHGIKEAGDALREAPDALKPPLNLVLRDLIAMDAEMLKLLFPSPPHHNDKP
jgi:hypothetical protein